MSHSFCKNLLQLQWPKMQLPVVTVIGPCNKTYNDTNISVHLRHFFLWAIFLPFQSRVVWCKILSKANNNFFCTFGQRDFFKVLFHFNTLQNHAKQCIVRVMTLLLLNLFASFFYLCLHSWLPITLQPCEILYNWCRRWAGSHQRSSHQRAYK